MDLEELREYYFAELMPSASSKEHLDYAKNEQDLEKEINSQYGEQFDIRRLMDEAHDPLTGTLRDLRIDDRDLPTAKNYFDFCYNYLSGNVPWSRQMWSMLKFFGEICPHPKCSDRRWVDNVLNIPKDFPTKDLPERLTFLEHGVCPKCKRNKRQLIKHGRMMNYKEAVFVWGQRSGKSTTVTSGSAYHLHRFLKFPVFGTMTNLMQASTPLTMTFVSLTYGKAYAVLWEPFTNFIAESPWFNQYFEMLDYHGNKYGKELYAYKKEFIKFFHKKLNLAPSHPDKSILRGETRFGAAIDELGLFPLPKGDEEEDEESQRANADEAHKSLTNSLTTVQSVADMLLQQGHFHVPNGYMFGVSSPFSERDKVMRLLKDSRGEEGKKFIFGSQLATWEINPGIHRDSPMIALAYEKNFEKADRDFGANPPRVDSPYIQSDVIREGVFEGKRNSHLLTYTFTPKYIGGTIRQVADVLLPTCLSLDAGEVDNSFAITGTSYDFKTGKTIVHTVLEVIPQQGLRINHDNLYTTVILPLAKALNARAVVADRWNSLNILHRLENDLPWEVYIRQISPRRDDFDMFTKMLIDKTVILPRPEIAIDKLLEAEVEDYRTFFLNKPVAHLAHQITTVREVSPVKPPEKGTGYTDDTYRATILGATKIHLPKIKEILEKAEKISRTTVKRSGAVFISRSGF